MHSVAQYPLYSKVLALVFCLMVSSFGNTQAAILDCPLNTEIVNSHGEFNIEKVKSEIKELIIKYTKASSKPDQKQIVINLENTLKRQIKEYPTHEKEILDAAKTIIKEGAHNWIILRNETQLKINVIADQPATSKG